MQIHQFSVSPQVVCWNKAIICRQLQRASARNASFQQRSLVPIEAIKKQDQSHYANQMRRLQRDRKRAQVMAVPVSGGINQLNSHSGIHVQVRLNKEPFGWLVPIPRPHRHSRAGTIINNQLASRMQMSNFISKPALDINK